MKLNIRTKLDYRFAEPSDLLLQVEAAVIPEQRIDDAWIGLSACDNFARIPAQDGIGERLWLRVEERLTVDYRATVTIDRRSVDWGALAKIPLHQLPAEAVQYLMASRYCFSDQFETFVKSEFGHLEGGAQILAMRDWIEAHVSYVPGVSTSDTTALDTFVRRQGICRDFAHVMITLARAAGVPARIASVYALGVEPQDFHAVAEIFLSGAWHLIDATGMAREGVMATIGVGRDAADVAFLTAYGDARLHHQSVWVEAAA